MWFEGVQTQRRRENKGNINTWAKLKKHLRMKYVPLSYRQLSILTPLPPRKTMTTPTKQVLTKRDCYEDQTQLQAKILKTIEDAPVDLELTKPTTVDDIGMNKLCLKNPSTCCNENDFQFMNNKEASCLVNKNFTTEISDEQVKQQANTLNSSKGEALDTELIKTIPVDNIENNKLHQESLYAYCDQAQQQPTTWKSVGDGALGTDLTKNIPTADVGLKGGPAHYKD